MNVNCLASGYRVITPSRLFLRGISLSRRQRGQALPLGIAFIMIGMLGALVLFNTGQVAVDKQRLSDAADSAAYSGMVWQARALNFQAYTNRAMIANDVTIGQAVSLNSWSTYAQISTENIALVTSIVPGLNIVTNFVSTTFSALNAIIDPVSQAMVIGMNGMNKAIELSQLAMFTSAFIATPDLVKQVAEASDEDFEVLSGYAVGGLAMNLQSWNSFTEKYEQNDMNAMQERTDLISESRDRFTKERRWKFFDSFWFFATPFVQYRVYYNGQTKLLMSQGNGGNGTPNWEWVAKDAMSLNVKTFRVSWRGIRSNINDLPIGWASAYANSDGLAPQTIHPNNSGCRNYTTLDGESCNYLGSRNENAEELANRGPKELSGYHGVNAFRSISQAVLADDDGTGDPVLRLRTEISMDIEKTETSDDWIGDSEPFATQMTAPADKLSSISIAEVYYRHPKSYRTSNDAIALQRANGYNPYWDVRLAPIEMEERLAALALRGDLGGGSSGATPGSNSGGSNIQVAGNISSLPQYVGTLASVTGIDDAVGGALQSKAQELLIQHSGLSQETIDTFKSYANLDAIEDELKEKAKDALEEAMERMLTSFVGDSLDGYIAQGQQFLTDVESLIDDAQELSDRMEALRDQAAAEFEAALLREVGPYELVLDGIRLDLNAKILELADLNRIASGFERGGDGPVAQIRAVEGQIEDLRQDAVDATQGLLDTITDSVLNTLITHGSEFFIGGVTHQLRDFIESDLHPLILEYLNLSVDERDEHEAGSVLPWEDEEEEEEDSPVPVGEYGDFEN